MGTVKYFELYQFPFVLNRFLAVTVELYCRSCLFTLFKLNSISSCSENMCAT